MLQVALSELKVGEQLGNLEYTIDSEVLANYQLWLPRESRFPNIAADDCQTLLLSRCGPLELRQVWQQLLFLRPPILGRRIQVGGWLKDRIICGDGTFVRVSAFAVDEIGTEILRSESGFWTDVQGSNRRETVPETPVIHDQATGVWDTISSGMHPVEQMRAGDTLEVPPMKIPGGADLEFLRNVASGLTGISQTGRDAAIHAAIAGWLEGCLGQWFGDDFWWGGQLSIVHREPALPGDALFGDATVINRDADERGRITYRIVLQVRNQTGRDVALAEAVATVPSPRTL